MGWITARQPNGKICILSTVVDQIIYDNLSDDEYIKVYVQRAIENAKMEAERNVEYMIDRHDFDEIKDGFYPDSEVEIKNIRNWLKSVGDPDWDKYNYELS